MISFGEVNDGLLQLGFENGWAYSDIGYPEGVIIWEHPEPLPSIPDLKKAALAWQGTVAAREKASQAKREELLKKLGLTSEEFHSLVSEVRNG